MAAIIATLPCSNEVLGENLNLTTQSLKVYRAGIIGASWIALYAPDNHFTAYKGNSRIKYIGKYDKNPERTDFETLDCFLIEEPDIVSVCTPPETHAEIVCTIAPYVRAIYCEKPIALTIQDAERMIDTCHKYGVILQVNHQRRFINPVFHFSRDLVDTGTHVFDRLRQLFGEPLELTRDYIRFKSITVDLDYIKSGEHIFDLDCVRNKEPMIPLGVQHLVECLDEGKESISSGEESRKTLALVLKFRELYEST